MELLFNGCPDHVHRKSRYFQDQCSMKLHGLLTKKARDCIAYDMGSMEECVIHEDAERLRNYAILQTLPKYVFCVSDVTFSSMCRLKSNVAILCSSAEKCSSVATYIANRYQDRFIVGVIGKLVRVNEKKDVRDLVCSFLSSRVHLPMDIAHSIYTMSYVKPTEPLEDIEALNVRDRAREREQRRQNRIIQQQQQQRDV